MAQRPIFWALGIAATVVVSALSYSERLARGFGDERPNIGSVTSAAKPASTARPTLTVAADYRGHYMVHPTIDNYRVKMMVDTGASIVALTADDARALGIAADTGGRKILLSTANGALTGTSVMLREIRLGDIVVRNVEAVVLPAGALQTSLLGTSFLGKLQGYEVQTGRMVLRG